MSFSSSQDFKEPRSFVRNRQRPLNGAQKARLDQQMPELAIDLERPALPFLETFCAPTATSLWLEVGFGGGEHLFARLGQDPHRHTLGCEVYEAGVAKLLHQLTPEMENRVRLFQDDARLLLDWLPPASLDGVELLYPDPWPKRRHHKRRFLSEANLDRLSRVIKPGGLFRFATDIDDYADWGLRFTRTHPAFTWTAKRSRDWSEAFPGWPGTRYEQKALREGRTPAYFTFVRNPKP